LGFVLSAQSWTEDQGELGSEDDLLALGADVEAKVGEPMGEPLAGAALEGKTEAVSGILRCPVCQGLSVADSPSESARNMKRQIRAMVAAGYEAEQISDYFVGAYGDFVLMAPEKEGFNLVVWLAPIGVLLVGGLLGLSAIRRGSAASRVEEEAAPKAEAEGELDPWVARIRAEASEE